MSSGRKSAKCLKIFPVSMALMREYMACNAIGLYDSTNNVKQFSVRRCSSKVEKFKQFSILDIEEQFQMSITTNPVRLSSTDVVYNVHKLNDRIGILVVELQPH